MQGRNQWRTMLFLMFLASLELAAVALLKGGGEVGQKMLADFTYGLGFLGAIQGGKALGEFAAVGPGLKGLGKVLLTDAKPGDPAPPSAPAAQP